MMSDKKHHHDHKNHSHRPKRPPHKGWRLWAVVVLMLASMASYVLSFDESLQPGGDGEQEVPAALDDAE